MLDCERQMVDLAEEGLVLERQQAQATTQLVAVGENIARSLQFLVCHLKDMAAPEKLRQATLGYDSALPLD